MEQFFLQYLNHPWELGSKKWPFVTVDSKFGILTLFFWVDGSNLIYWWTMLRTKSIWNLLSPRAYIIRTKFISWTDYHSNIRPTDQHLPYMHFIFFKEIRLRKINFRIILLCYNVYNFDLDHYFQSNEQHKHEMYYRES